MDDEMFAAREVRKKLWWMMPFSAGMVFIFWWLTFDIVLRSFVELSESSPSARLYAGGLVAPFLTAAMAIVLVLLPMRAIPYVGIWFKRLELLLLGLTLASIAVIVLGVFGSALIQNHYMPKLGYTRCNLLQGNPTLWFSDWVKNPEWCVRGKSRAWVHEQAGVQPPKY